MNRSMFLACQYITTPNVENSQFLTTLENVLMNIFKTIIELPDMAVKRKNSFQQRSIPHITERYYLYFDDH